MYEFAAVLRSLCILLEDLCFLAFFFCFFFLEEVEAEEELELEEELDLEEELEFEEEMEPLDFFFFMELEEELE